MASAASGRNAHHLLIANSGRRCLQHVAAVVVSSFSSQFHSNCSVVGLQEEQLCWQGKKRNSGVAEHIWSPLARPSSLSPEDKSQCCTERAPHLDCHCSLCSDVAIGSRERRRSQRLTLRAPMSSWMSASIMDERDNPPSSCLLYTNLFNCGFRLASRLGPAQFIFSSREVGLQQEAEIEICQGKWHVKEASEVWQNPRELQTGHVCDHHRGGGGCDKSGQIARDGRNIAPTLGQFLESSLLSSSWGSRHCMRSSRRFALQQEHAFTTDHGRMGVGELSRVRIWHNPRRFHMGHAHHHHRGGGHDKSGKASERVLGWGLWGDIGLAIGKGGAGYVSGSTALIADAAHSVSDIALSGVALWTSKVAHAPKDKQHPYGKRIIVTHPGHGKFESIGALGISGMLLLTGGGIAWHALESLQPFLPMMSEWVQTTGHSHDHAHGGGHHHGIDLQHPYMALTAAVGSIGVKEILYQRTRAIGEAQNSELLKASAWHHRSDAISSIVALLGVGGAILGMPLLDPIAGFVVSGMIVKAGFDTGYQSLQDLADSGVPESILAPIRTTVLAVEGVEGCHHLRGRRMGSFIHIDAHIEVDPWLSVSAAHNIAEAVRHQVHETHPEVTETFVHIEPADGGIKTLTHQEAEIEHELHDHQGDFHKHPEKNELSFNKKDLTNLGSKSDLMKSSHKEECLDDGFEIDTRQHSGIEQDVRSVVGANLHEKMRISQVTSHFVHGKVVVEVEVSMNPEISVRNAMNYADEAQQVILERVSDISSVRLQLKLSRSSTQSL